MAERLLILEDHKSIADMVKLVAEESGFETRVTFGEWAIKAYEDFEPDAIVLDILMPGMDGFEFIEFLEQQNSALSVIILSGSSEGYRKVAELLGQSSGLCIVANINKPFRLNELRSAIQQLKIGSNANRKLA